jgi:hypothetical protein
MKWRKTFCAGVQSLITAVAVGCGSSEKIVARECTGEERFTLAITGPAFTPDAFVSLLEGRNPSSWGFQWQVKATAAKGSLVSAKFRDAADTTRILVNVTQDPFAIPGYLSFGVAPFPNGNVPSSEFFDVIQGGRLELLLHTTAQSDTVLAFKLISPYPQASWQPRICYGQL